LRIEDQYSNVVDINLDDIDDIKYGSDRWVALTDHKPIQKTKVHKKVVTNDGKVISVERLKQINDMVQQRRKEPTPKKKDAVIIKEYDVEESEEYKSFAEKLMDDDELPIELIQEIFNVQKSEYNKKLREQKKDDIIENLLLTKKLHQKCKKRTKKHIPKKSRMIDVMKKKSQKKQYCQRRISLRKDRHKVDRRTKEKPRKIRLSKGKRDV